MDPAVAWMNAHPRTQSTVSFLVGAMGMSAIVYVIYCIVMLIMYYFNPSVVPPLV